MKNRTNPCRGLTRPPAAAVLPHLLAERCRLVMAVSMAFGCVAPASAQLEVVSEGPPAATVEARSDGEPDAASIAPPEVTDESGGNAEAGSDAKSSVAEGGIEEIVVTANKRSENISSVGMSITAFSGEALQNSKITDIADIAATVPGLVFSPSTTNTPILTIRGIGFNESSLGVYPAVSAYVDEAPLPFPVMAGHVAFDLERVEILKGPQGTLFGQNSTGGAVNFIASKPTADYSSQFSVGVGNYNQVESGGYINGAVSDQVNARLAFTALSADGWQKSSSRGDRNAAQDYFAGRFLVEYKPSDTLRLLLSLNRWNDRSEPQAQQFVAYSPQIAAFSTPALEAEPLSREDASAADWSESARPAANRRLTRGTLRVDYDLREDLTLTSLTSSARYKQGQTTDGDGSALVLFDLEKNDGDIDSFSQELRLSNASSSSVKWLVGANLEHSNTFEDQVLRYTDSTNNNPDNLNINASGVRLDQQIDSYAVFGDLQYSLLDQLTAKIGTRYTSSRIKANNCGYSPGDFAVGNLFNYLGGALGTVPFTPIDGPEDCYTLNQNSVPGQAFVDTLKEDNVSWRTGLEYTLPNDALLYGLVSRGYKTGSYPSLAAATFAQLPPVTQEKLTAYEVGMKSRFLDRRLQVNAATFYYNYRDKQARGKVADPIFGILDTLVNVPKSHVYGAELDLTAAPSTGLTLTASLTYLKSEVDRYTGINVLGSTESFNGDRLPFTPEWSYAVGANYSVPYKDGALFVGSTYHGQSNSDAAFGGDRITWPTVSPARSITPDVYLIDSYGVLDAHAGYDASKWKLLLWAKNLANEYYTTNVIAASDSAARLVGRPRTYGLTLTFYMN